MQEQPSILFSHDIFAAQATGGVSRCMIELMRALHPAWSGPWKLFAGANTNMLLADEMTEPWFRARANGYVRATGGRSPVTIVCNEVALRRHAAGNRLVHRTYHPVVDLLPTSTLVVETVHDLWDFVARGEHGARAAFRRHMKHRALKRADRIVCVSQSTLNYLNDIHPDLARRAIVIPHGTRRLSDRPVRVDPRLYFLFVGQRGRYKNFGIVLAALGRMGTTDTELVCFGGGAFTPEERQEINRLELGDRVRQVGGDDHCLAGYYEGAGALVYPSRHEGFGLPLLEAMAHDCPVIAAPLTSLPEVGGDAVAYADADDADAWAAAMERTLDTATRATMITAGRRRVAGFSWDNAAQRHATLYQEMLP